MNILANYPPVLKAQSLVPTDKDTLQIEYEDLASQYNYVQANFREAITNKPKESTNNIIREKNGSYEINLNDFNTTEVYKGQIRFVSTNNINSDEFSASEWSGWFLFKKINTPGNNILDISIDKTDVPRIKAELNSNGLNWVATNQETINKYKFIIKPKTSESVQEKIIEESDWIQVIENKPFEYQTETLFDQTKEYQIELKYQTLNMYENFMTWEFQPENQFDITTIGLKVHCETDPEEGTIQVYLNKDNSIEEEIEVYNKVYAISRTSSKSNYTKWEQLTEFVLEKEGLAYIDYTVEDGIGYEYAVQRIQTAAGGRTGRVPSNQVEAQLAYAYLWDGRAQLKLKYNNKISAIKRNVLASKQDTIGGKYPVIYRNGTVNYFEFPITGLISLHLDENHNFFTYDEKTGYYYKDELVIPIQKLGVDTKTGEPFGLTTNLTPDNIFIERVFREKVEEFLNSPSEKLYRSPTEGNFMVYLLNTSFTPNQTLGRMISEFSATACEIAEATIDHMRDIKWIKTEFTEEERNNIYVEDKSLRLENEPNTNPTAALVAGQLSVQTKNLLDRLQNVTFKDKNIKDIYVETIQSNSDINLVLKITGLDGSDSNILILPGQIYYANSFIKTLGVVSPESADGYIGQVTGYARREISPFSEEDSQTYELHKGINQIIGAIGNNYEYTNEKGETVTNNPLNLLALALFFTNDFLEPDMISVGFTLNKVILGNIQDKAHLIVNGKDIFISGNTSDYTFDYDITSMKLVEGTIGSFYYEYYGYVEVNETTTTGEEIVNE